MPQVCSTIPQSTINAISEQAATEKRHFSQMVSIILQEWEARNKSKNAKK